MSPHKLSREIEMFPVAALVGRPRWSGYIWHAAAIVLDRRRIRHSDRFCVVDVRDPAIFMFCRQQIAHVRPCHENQLRDPGQSGRVAVERRFMILVWAVTGSLGFYGIKDDLLPICTCGRSRVWGPKGAFIEGNNEMALSMITSWPGFVQLTSTNAWVRRGMHAFVALCAAAAPHSHSRGALRVTGATGLVLAMSSERNAPVAIFIGLARLMRTSFAPAEWTAHMNIPSTNQSDDSTMGCIIVWWLASNAPSSNLLGGGFGMGIGAVVQVYAPVPDDVHAARSVYFRLLGGHGFAALLLLLTMWLLAWIKVGKLKTAGPMRTEA